MSFQWCMSIYKEKTAHTGIQVPAIISFQIENGKFIKKTIIILSFLCSLWYLIFGTWRNSFKFSNFKLYLIFVEGVTAFAVSTQLNVFIAQLIFRLRSVIFYLCASKSIIIYKLFNFPQFRHSWVGLTN